VKSIVNISSGSPNFPWSLTVYENLRYFAMLYGLKNKDKAIKNVIDLLELEPFRNSRFDSLSTGTKQRLSLAKALLNEPRLLFLDEPTVGLDPDMAIKIVAENAGSILDRILKLFCDVRIKNIDISQPDLEDVFLELAR
jgi:ABC-2 type transport system ATP-binding protein